MEKIRLALITTVMDNRAGRGTALVARELVPRILAREDLFDITLIHHEQTDNPIYTQYKTLQIPHLPALLDRQLIREAVFWFTLRKQGVRFDVAHYMNPRIWPSYLLTPAKHIVFTAFEAGVMLNLHKPGLADYAFRLTNRFLNQRMTRIVSCSEYGRTEIMEAYHVPGDRVVSIPLGVDARFKPVELTQEKQVRLAELGFKQPYILSVGRLDPHKNIHRLVSAFGRIQTEFPSLQLALVGGKHLADYTTIVDAEIARIPDPHAVFFAPFIPDDDLPLVYSGASLFVYPSVHEGFGLPIIEAMACGTPVVTGNLTASPETAGGAAVLVNPESVEDIAEGMRSVLQGPVLAQELVTRGRAHAATYSWDEMGARFIALYKSMRALRS